MVQCTLKPSEQAQLLSNQNSKLKLLCKIATEQYHHAWFSQANACYLLKKNVLLANQESMVKNEYVRHCDSRYVVWTNQRLQKRIQQHVRKAINKELFLLSSRKLTDTNQQKSSQKENAKHNVSLNSD